MTVKRLKSLVLDRIKLYTNLLHYNLHYIMQQVSRREPRSSNPQKQHKCSHQISFSITKTSKFQENPKYFEQHEKLDNVIISRLHNKIFTFKVSLKQAL